MQRILLLAVGLAVLLPAAATGQEAAGTALWRLAGTTLPVAPALATGPAATFWNPAQLDDSARTQIAIDVIQTPASINATGMIGAVRRDAGRVGELGIVYGRVWLSDLARTTDSPDSFGSEVPVYTFALGATWARELLIASRRITLGATLAYHETRLDVARSTRWTVDVGASHALTGRLRLAAATHFFSSLTPSEGTQDIYAGLEYRAWEGPLWGDRAVLRGRYGLAFGHGFAADHHVGVGWDFGSALTLDAAVVREGGYTLSGWRPVAGLRLRIGKYRITLARDAGVEDLGSAYRVGVEARFP